MISREIARRLPGSVRRVITFGSPVVGGPTFTATASAFGEEECRRAAEVSERLDADDPINVPITAIYTKQDGVVSWRACIDRTSAEVQHVEVASTHFGLGIDPDVWEIVARRLAG